MNPPSEQPIDSIEDFERAAIEARASRYMLRLYISGAARASVRAIENIKKICEEFLPGRYELEVIDIRQQPERARSDQVIAMPTLIRRKPPPPLKLIGDFSDTERAIQELGLKEGEG